MTAEHTSRILVVDDDDNLRRLVAAYLEREGYEVAEAADGPAALREAESQRPDLMILDLMLPGLDGLEVARRVTASKPMAILMLTARSAEDDVLLGFEAGADDYLIKPFSPKVMLARVRAILRRGRLEPADTSTTLVLGDLSLDPRTREATVARRSLDLTATEFELLRVLAEHPGWVHSREDLLERVWGYKYLGDSRAVDVHIANLRKKLGDDPSDPQHIRTVRGVGYKLRSASQE
jgi:two-component system alkaline phosphatase synthesis response regulator PhoP